MDSLISFVSDNDQVCTRIFSWYLGEVVAVVYRFKDDTLSPLTFRVMVDMRRAGITNSAPFFNAIYDIFDMSWVNCRERNSRMVDEPNIIEEMYTISIAGVIDESGAREVLDQVRDSITWYLFGQGNTAQV